MPSSSKSPTLVRNLPVARFRYKGSHAKPVRREIAVISRTSNTVTGYQLREGNDTYDFSDAEIRTFSKEKIVDGTLEQLPLSEIDIDVPARLRTT